MKIIKSLAPVLILILLSAYVYQHYALIPESIINGLVFLPNLLALLLIGLAIHFNRSMVFFYLIIISVVYTILKLDLFSDPLNYAMLSSFVPFLIVILSILPERGILSVKTLPAYALIILTAWFAISISMDPPMWAKHFFLNEWIPEKYFDWTQQSQMALAFSATSALVLLVIFFVRPSPYTSAGLGILVLLLIQLHLGHSDKSLLILSSAALLMCLYAVLQEFWRLAYMDELTGLPGRRALREKFQQISGTYTMAMLDVDHFKKFNDTYGHDIGDSVLRMIAGKLNKVGGGGVAYRYGGEEFTIVYAGKRKTEVLSYLETLRESIATTPFVVNRANRRSKEASVKAKKIKSVQVTISIGVSDSEANVNDPWDVLKLADKALYKAKKKGRNCVAT